MKIAVLATVALAAVTEASRQLPEGVVRYDIQGFRTMHPPNPRFKGERYSSLFKRDTDGTLQYSLDNEFTHYTIEIEVGTPGQKQHVALDTGSSDLWVIDKNNPYCAKTSKEKTLAEMGQGYILCDSETGTFDPKKSSSYKDKKSNFEISYGDFSFAKGTWAEDVVKIGDTKVKDVIFAVGEETNSSMGVFGIGFKEFESSVINSKVVDFDKAYDNFPVKLKKDGITDSVAYSLWLNDPDAKTGNVLFGGVDHAKYSGDLQLVPIVNDIKGVDKPIELTVILSSLGIKPKKGDDTINVLSNNLPVLLDSGTTACLFPQQVISEIADSLKAEYSSTTGTYLQECDAIDDSGSFVFDFSGLKIEVPFDDMILPVRDIDGNPLKFRNGKEACQLTMSPASDSVILGDSFLRSAYVVYDLENYQVAMAPVKFNESKSDVEAIKSGIPKAKKAASYSNTKPASQLSLNTDISYTATATGDIGSLVGGTVAATGGGTGTPDLDSFLSSITSRLHAHGTSGSDDDDSSAAPSFNKVPVYFSALLFVLLTSCILY